MIHHSKELRRWPEQQQHHQYVSDHPVIESLIKNDQD
jgi:hypothetical protein